MFKAKGKLSDSEKTSIGFAKIQRLESLQNSARNLLEEDFIDKYVKSEFSKSDLADFHDDISMGKDARITSIGLDLSDQLEGLMQRAIELSEKEFLKKFKEEYDEDDLKAFYNATYNV